MVNVNLHGVFLYAKSVCWQCHSQPKNLWAQKKFWWGQNVEF